MRKTPDQATRLYMYLLGVAVVAVLIFYGIIGEESRELWENLLLAFLGLTGVQAAANVKRHPGPYDPPVLEDEEPRHADGRATGL